MPHPHGLQAPSSTSLWEGTHLARQKKGKKHTAKRTIVIQTDRCAFKTQNSSLTRRFCSNRLLFGDDDVDGGDEGRCGVVDFFSCGVVELFSSSIMHHAPRARAHPHHIVPRTDRTDVTI